MGCHLGSPIEGFEDRVLSSLYQPFSSYFVRISISSIPTRHQSHAGRHAALQTGNVQNKSPFDERSCTLDFSSPVRASI